MLEMTGLSWQRPRGKIGHREGERRTSESEPKEAVFVVREVGIDADGHLHAGVAGRAATYKY